jgi:hypothetical protein
MENLNADTLTIELMLGDASTPVQIVWRGKSGDRNPSKILGPYLSKVVAAANERKVPLEVHFEKLEYFNSATITAIVGMIQDARARSVRLSLVYDPKLQWQRLSFDALRVFAKDGQMELRSS